MTVTPKEAKLAADGVTFEGKDGVFTAKVEFQQSVKLVATLDGHDSVEKTITIPSKDVKETIELKKAKVIQLLKIIFIYKKKVMICIFSVQP